MTKTSFYARTRLFAIASLLSALSFAFSASALAGVDLTPLTTGNCFQSGTTESCYGTMAGIRNQTTDPGRSAEFAYSIAGTTTTYFFDMYFNGVDYACLAPPSMNDAFKTAMASSGYFLIQYNINTGVCTYLQLEAGSSQKNASNL